MLFAAGSLPRERRWQFKRRVPLAIQALLCFTSIGLSPSVQAVGEEILDAVMRSDFVFDRNVSDVPFFPLAYLKFSQQRNLQFSDCQSQLCEFDYSNVSQAFGMPVWVGQKHMLVLAETLERDTLSLSYRTIDVDSAGVLAAWISQPNENLQAGGFVYVYRSLGEDELTKEPKGNIAGIATRYRHRSHFHSYWGLIMFDEHDSQQYFPYAGFDWYVNQKWSISAILPWPAISYAPSEEQLFRLGVLLSGSEWASNKQGQIIKNDFTQLDIGLSYERRILGNIWAGFETGYSGFGRFLIEDDFDIQLESNVEASPFVKAFINFRP